MSRREAFIGFPFFDRKDNLMHFLSLVTMEIPEIIENENTNKEIEVQIEKSKEVQNHILRELMLGKLRSLKSTFSREVTSYINDIMDPYSETPTNQHYWNLSTIPKNLSTITKREQQIVSDYQTVLW